MLTCDFIVKSIWGSQAVGDNEILRVNITKLRKKLEYDPSNPRYILTENGVGYRIADTEENNPDIPTRIYT